MASLTIPCGRNHPAIHHQYCRLRVGLDRRNSNPNRIAQCHRCRRGPRMSATTANSPVSALCPVNPASSNNGSLVSDNLDRWMRDSAVEIVKNLREAPLLLQVYANNCGGEAATLETEKAIADDHWPVVTRRWKDGETPPPDGVILVKELGGDKEEDLEGEICTRAWGIVIQGKGVESGPASCYLMKTSRVESGLGLCCTHFCLTKIQDFSQSAVSQLTSCWLLE